MKNKQHETLCNQIDDLKYIVYGVTTRSLTNLVAHELNRFVRTGNRSKLISPSRQSIYLLGLICSEDARKDSTELSSDIAEHIIVLLNEVFTHFNKVHLEEAQRLSEESEDFSLKSHQIASIFFTHYFNQSRLASVEQFEWRCRDYIPKFDQTFKSQSGFSIDTGISAIKRIKEIQNAKILVYAESLETTRAAYERGSIDSATLQNQLRLASQLFEFYKDDLGLPPDEAIAFCNYLSIRRDASHSVYYMTDENPLYYGFLVNLEDGNYSCPIVNLLWDGFLSSIEKVLREQSAQGFLIFRDKQLEDKCIDLFQKIFPSASLYPSVYDSPDSSNEHDLIILHNRRLLAVEAKASPPQEPFRDPAKAFIRIQRQFLSDKGIQKGYDQAVRIRNILNEHGEIVLYDKKGNVVTTISSTEVDEVFEVCITRDDFGPLATNLEFLLRKEEQSPYPWSINILDLENLIEGFVFLSRNDNDFISYIRNRIKLYGKTFGDDELEYAGYFLCNNGFDDIVNSTVFHVLDAGASDIFDQIYMAKQTGENFVPKKLITQTIHRNRSTISTKKRRKKS